MIRFMLERGDQGKVKLSVIQGWAIRDGARFRDLCRFPGAYGYGADPTEQLERTAEVLLNLSLMRRPLVEALLKAFCLEFLAANHEPKWVTSSADIQEWTIDLIADWLASGAEIKTSGQRGKRGSDHVSRN